MGKGSVVVLAGIYLTSLILMTGLRPIHLVRQSVLATRRGFVALRLWLLRRRMRRADLKEQLEISQEQIAKQQRAIEKKLRKKGVPEPAEPFATPEEFANRPEPKVVDTTALPTEPAPPRKKPSLAELKRGGEIRRPRFNNGSGMGCRKLRAARNRSARGTRQRRPCRGRSGGAGGNPADA